MLTPLYCIQSNGRIQGRRHRLPGFSICSYLPFVNKKILVPRGEQGQEIHNLRYHLVCRFRGHSSRRHHAACPITPAMRQDLLRGKPVSACPRRPMYCSAFRSGLSNPGLSVDALAAPSPRQRFCGIGLGLLNYKSVLLSSTNFHILWLREKDHVDRHLHGKHASSLLAGSRRVESKNKTSGIILPCLQILTA